MGGFGPFLERKALAIHDRLLARAVVLEVAGTRAALVGCDLGAVSQEVTEKVRSEVQRVTGIPRQRILVAATHTHSAPTVARWIGWGERDEKYLSELPQKIARAVIEAYQKLQPATLSYGEARVEGVAMRWTPRLRQEVKTQVTVR